MNDGKPSGADRPLMRPIRAKGYREGRDPLAIHARQLLGPYAHHHKFEAGSLLWREGEDAGLLVAIESGRVKIYRILANGNAVTLYLFGPGDVFGFMPFLDGRSYPATAQALDDVTALVMPRSELLSAFQRDPELALTLVKLLATRLREAFDRIERASVPEVLPRVAAALALLLPEDLHPGTLAIVELPVRAREFAGAIGVAPPSLSRAVTKLVQAGVLHRLGPRRFQVLDPLGLHHAAQGPG